MVQKYQITDGAIEGAIDNLTVVIRINDGINEDTEHKQHLSTDIDVWNETEVVS